jgi:leader peptidase (prepilin peptidase) / N-methyltransferase
MPALIALIFEYADGIATVILAAVLIRLVIIDLQEFRLPDRLTLPLIGLGLGLAAWRLGDWPVQALIGAALGYGVFWLIGFVYFRWRGVDGLGQGDAKLLAAAGAWLGSAALPWVVLLAAVGALFWALATGRGRVMPLAFGPWLAGGFWAMWIARLVQGYF